MEALHLIRSEDQSRNVKAEGRNCDAKRCLANRWKFFPNVPWDEALPFVPANRSGFPDAESAHSPNDKAYQQNQAKSAAADDGAAKIKSATAKQEQQNHDE